jgi:hypothetical protein
MFFSDLKLVLPWVILLVSEFRLVILETSAGFLQRVKIVLPLDVQQLKFGMQ